MKTLTSIFVTTALIFGAVSSADAAAKKSIKKKSKSKKAIPAAQQAPSYATRADVQLFIAEMVREHGFNEAALRDIFKTLRPNAKVIELMDAPVRRPAMWYEYVPRFMSDPRIDDGVAFAKANAAALARAEAQYGVPASVIVAIIGVETFYGRVTGGFTVIEALATLAFDYPRRADFFRGELRSFLLLNRDMPSVMLSAKGSYAGAMGLPQFMPGSYRNYAVDFDGDGNIDLWRSPADIIGSVAAYFARHGWAPGQPVWSEIKGLDPAILPPIDGGNSVRQTLKAFAASGIPAAQNLHPSLLPESEASVLMLEEHDGPRYYLAYNNWYVITRYNRSRLYASAVWTLAEAIRARAG